MTLNNRTFTLLKIVLLIIISIFIAEIIVLPKLNMICCKKQVDRNW